MNNDELNRNYWANVAPEKILAGLSFPGTELTRHLQPHSHIIDIGCGSGKVAEHLFEKGYAVTGIDINQQALDENKKRNRNIIYKKANITHVLPFPDASFDAAVVSYVFVSIVDPRNARTSAKEITRILKPEGYLWVCEGTLSADYTERYTIGKAITGMDQVALTLVKGTDTDTILRTKQYAELIQKSLIERVIRHYTEKELDDLFSSLSKVETSKILVTSPNSGMTVESIRTVYYKPT